MTAKAIRADIAHIRQHAAKIAGIEADLNALIGKLESFSDGLAGTLGTTAPYVGRAPDKVGDGLVLMQRAQRRLATVTSAVNMYATDMELADGSFLGVAFNPSSPLGRMILAGLLGGDETTETTDLDGSYEAKLKVLFVELKKTGQVELEFEPDGSVQATVADGVGAGATTPPTPDGEGFSADMVAAITTGTVYTASSLGDLLKRLAKGARPAGTSVTYSLEANVDVAAGEHEDSQSTTGSITVTTWADKSKTTTYRTETSAEHTNGLGVAASTASSVAVTKNAHGDITSVTVIEAAAAGGAARSKLGVADVGGIQVGGIGTVSTLDVSHATNVRDQLSYLIKKHDVAGIASLAREYGATSTTTSSTTEVDASIGAADELVGAEVSVSGSETTTKTSVPK